MNPSFSPDYFKVATNDGHNFYLLEDVTYTSKDGTVYILPKGATSDGASVPEVLWNVLPPFGKYWQAAYLHDCAYRDTLKTADGAYASLDETKSNDLLKEAMELAGVEAWAIFNIYEGVVLGGRSSFLKDRAAGRNSFLVQL